MCKYDCHETTLLSTRTYVRTVLFRDSLPRQRLLRTDGITSEPRMRHGGLPVAHGPPLFKPQ
jgi:hypothetical protein